MMKGKGAVLFWTDLHIHPWQEGQRAHRWKDGISVIQKIYGDFDVLDSICAVFFCGDLFESRLMWRSDIASDVFLCFAQVLARLDMPCIFVAGNHDYYKGTGVSLLRSIGTGLKNKHVHIVDGIGATREFTFNGSTFGCLDYSTVHKSRLGDSAAKDVVKNTVLNSNVLITHCDLKGGYHYGGHCSTKSDIDEQVIAKAKGLRFIVNGHYHIPQTFMVGKVKVICPGAVMQHCWRDMDTDAERGATAFNIKEGSCKRLLIPTPIFWSSIEKAGDHFSEIDFVRSVPKAKGEIKSKRLNNSATQKIASASILEAFDAYCENDGVSAKRRKTMVELLKEIQKEGS